MNSSVNKKQAKGNTGVLHYHDGYAFRMMFLIIA